MESSIGGERRLLKFGFFQDALKSVSLSSRVLCALISTKPGTVIGKHCRSLLLIAFVLALCVVAPPSADAATVTLGWDANDEPDLEGYVLYRNTGSPGPPYQYWDDVPEDDLVDPLHPEATLTNLQEGNTYYIALTAYNTEDVESSFSNDICVEVVNGVVEPCSQSTVSSASQSSGGSSDGDDDSGGGGGGGGAGHPGRGAVGRSRVETGDGLAG